MTTMAIGLHLCRLPLVFLHHNSSTNCHDRLRVLCPRRNLHRHRHSIRPVTVTKAAATAVSLVLVASSLLPSSSCCCSSAFTVTTVLRERSLLSPLVLPISPSRRSFTSTLLNRKLKSTGDNDSTTETTTTMADSVSEPNPTPKVLQFVDIGANLLDDRYTAGKYFGKQRHEPDFDLVLERSIDGGVTHLILTAGTVEESRTAIHTVRNLRRKFQTTKEEEEQQQQQQQRSPPQTLFIGCTVGVHPTRCQQEFVDNVLASNNEKNELGEESQSSSAQAVLNELRNIAIDGMKDSSVVALGEFGLDYDRLEFSPKDIQQEFFKKQLETFAAAGSSPSAEVDADQKKKSSSETINLVSSLPLFLHNRSVGRDLLEMLQEFSRTSNNMKLRGVVHSFDDTIELANEFIDMGLYIALNGCSLKTEENLKVVQELPLTSILLETDCPYCEIKPTHAGFKYVNTTFEKKVEKKFQMGTMVKGRNEPNQIIQVAEVIAGVKNLSVEDVAHQCYQNSLQLYYTAAADGKDTNESIRKSKKKNNNNIN